jgi:hypothetical protein
MSAISVTADIATPPARGRRMKGYGMSGIVTLCLIVIGLVGLSAIHHFIN